MGSHRLLQAAPHADPWAKDLDPWYAVGPLAEQMEKDSSDIGRAASTQKPPQAQSRAESLIGLAEMRVLVRRLSAMLRGEPLSSAGRIGAPKVGGGRPWKCQDGGTAWKQGGSIK